MPANKKSTNKTAHVLNMIAAGQDTESASPAPLGAAPMPTAEVPGFSHAAVLSPVVEVEHAPEDLSDQVREALSEELNNLDDDSFTAFQPETISSIGSAPIPTAAPSAPPAAAAQPIPPVRQSALIPSAQTSSSAKADAPQDGVSEKAETEEESKYINIMQALVEEKTPQYIKLLGVCSCSRCLADVKALALSHLEPKYIVVHSSQHFPYTVYENRYNAAVTSQIIAACRTVMGNPRH